MTLTELKTNYKVLKYKGKYLVYDNKEGSGKRQVYKYLCTIIEKDSNFKVDSDNYEHTDSLEQLSLQIDNYISKLKYDSELYNPMYLKGIFEEFAVDDYLKVKGFIGNRDSYTIKIDTYGKSIELTLHFTGLNSFDKIEENVAIRFDADSSGYSWHKVTCKRDADTIIETLETILYQFYLTHGAIAFGQLSKLKSTGKKLAINTEKIRNFNLISETYNDKLIEMLEEQLKILKS